MISSELSAVNSPFSGGETIHLAEVDSTMRYARRLIEAGGELDGTVIVADHQTAGVGRGEESRWEDEPGANLLMTVILKKGFGNPQVESLRISLLTALSVCDTLEPYAPEPPTLKWPNDVLLGGKKVCGVLCEQGKGYARLGIGLNLNARELPRAPRLPATSLALETGTTHSRAELLQRLLGRLAERFSEQSFPAEAVEERLAFRGRPVRCEVYRRGTTDTLLGRLLGIDRTGALLLETEGGVEKLHAGRLLSLRTV